MKKTIILMATLAAFASCSVDKPETSAERFVPGKKLITITATQEGGPQTRNVLDEDLIHVLWTPGDQINLFFEDQNACFISTNSSENTAITTFQGEMNIDVATGGKEGDDMESYFWGLYPYSKDARYNKDDGTIETFLPWEQTAEKKSFADDLFITIGRSTSWSMPFYNVCSGLRFTVDQEGINEVILRSNGGEPLAGRFCVGMDKETERPLVYDILDKSSSEIHLYPPKGQSFFYPDTYYYIVTLPGTLKEGFTLELIGLPHTASVSTSSPITFKRSRFIPTQLTANLYYADYIPLEKIDANIENEGVQKYLENVDYSEDLQDYRYSFIRDYLSLGVDKPDPVVFYWKNTAPRTLSITDPEDMSIVYSGDASGSQTKVYNLIPGKKYLYHVDADIYWDSSFTTEGTLRMIDVDGVRNVRDLGGWKAGDKRIRYGKVYRGAQLNNITDAGRNVFDALKISAEIDLRGNDAVNTLGMTNYYKYPATYYQITGSSGQYYIESIRRIILLLEENKSVYFHCMVGADRTGTLAFLLEALLGVSESDLSKDFELTSFYSDEIRTRNGQVNSNFGLKRLVSAFKAYSGESIQERVTNWANQNGLSLKEIEQLKDSLLE